MHSKIEDFIENPQLLIDIATSVIEELFKRNSSKELQNTKIQLLEINKAIKSLESKNISVPDGLRNEKMKLVSYINNFSVTSKLQILQNGFEELLSSMDSDEKAEIQKKRVRSKEPKTDNLTLRRIIIEVLKQMGGRAKVKDIKIAIEEILKDKFLPGDLLLRADGKTIAWFNNVQWERLRMVEAGILKKDSMTGYWELTGDEL